NVTGVQPCALPIYSEGKNTQDKDDNFMIINGSPTGKSTINIPYVDSKRKCISRYDTASIGGSHGEVIDDSYGHEFDSKYDQQWFADFETKSMKKSITTV